MSNAQRPSTARKVTRKTEEKRDDALDQGIRLTVDGESFDVRVGDVSPAIGRELRAVSGMSFMRLMDLVIDDPDVDVISAFVWVAQRIKGESVAFDDVEVTYAQMLSDGFDISLPGAEVVDESPEG